MMDIELTLNGSVRTIACLPGDTLLELLRREGCFSVRFGSETGETGAAAVLLDGRLVAADVLLAAQADGHEVTTVEQLNVAIGELHPTQQAFVETGALQSGYSAGAMVLATKALLERNPRSERARDPRRSVRDPRPRDRLREGRRSRPPRRVAPARRAAGGARTGGRRTADRPAPPTRRGDPPPAAPRLVPRRPCPPQRWSASPSGR